MIIVKLIKIIIFFASLMASLYTLVDVIELSKMDKKTEQYDYDSELKDLYTEMVIVTLLWVIFYALNLFS